MNMETTVSPAASRSGLKARESRRQVFLRARMRAGSAPMDICIRNISSRGMLIQAADPPPRGTYIEVLLPAHSIVARVAWTKARHFGVHTRTPIDVNAFIGHAIIGGSPSTTAASSSAASFKAERQTMVDTEQRWERSRRFSAILEFGFFIICSAAAAVVTIGTIFDFLTQTAQTIAGHL